MSFVVEALSCKLEHTSSFRCNSRKASTQCGRQSPFARSDQTGCTEDLKVLKGYCREMGRSVRLGTTGQTTEPTHSECSR